MTARRLRGRFTTVKRCSVLRGSATRRPHPLGTSSTTAMLGLAATIQQRVAYDTQLSGVGVRCCASQSARSAASRKTSTVAAASLRDDALKYTASTAGPCPPGGATWVK